MKSESSQKHYLTNAFIFGSLILIYLWNLDDLGAPRQGTESFYLAISKEMYNLNSYLTPIFDNKAHWSKPPLHFWLPFPFYWISGKVSLFAARLSMVFVGLLCSWGIAGFIKKFLGGNRIFAFLFLCSSLGLIKYSRIFMMEVTLALFTCLGTLYFFQFIQEKKILPFFSSIAFLAGGTLIKGPISLVMSYSSCFLFCAYSSLFLKENHWWKFILFFLGSLFLSSIWFLLSYYSYGEEFFQYFFIRENMGKFGAANYPVKVLFQGLFIYALPWGLYLPLAIPQLKERLKEKINEIDHKAIVFILLSFLTSFVIWMIPAQKSHHYAIPSLPFFLILLLYSSFLIKLPEKRKNLKNLTHFLIFLLMLSLMAILFFMLRIHEVFKTPHLLLKIDFAIFLVMLSCMAYLRNLSPTTKALSILYSLGIFWNVLIPSFALPKIPPEVLEISRPYEVAVVLKRHYFVEEALQKSVFSTNYDTLPLYLDTHPKSVAIISEEKFHSLIFPSKMTVLHTWSTWKKGLHFKEVLSILWEGHLTKLQEKMVLIKKS